MSLRYDGCVSGGDPSLPPPTPSPKSTPGRLCLKAKEFKVNEVHAEPRTPRRVHWWDEKTKTVSEIEVLGVGSAKPGAPDPVATHTWDISKATKADDAAIPTHLWDDRVWARFSGAQSSRRQARFQEAFGLPVLEALRNLFVRVWRRRLTRELLKYLRNQDPETSEDERKRNKTAGADCLVRASRCTWWEWKNGSRLFFWRWPRAHRQTARDGFPVWIKKDLPNYTKPQPYEKDPLMQGKVKGKLEKVVKQGYIEKGSVKSLTGYFWVEKGADDIRMVYDATKSGLNDCLWVPSFALPSIDTLTRAIDSDTWMGDLDLGDMFLNFCLDERIQPYCGVDLRPYFASEGDRKTRWERWGRCMMGLMSSPYVCIKGEYLANEVMTGDRSDPLNAYRWARIEMNLPGSVTYDPTKPRVMKLREDGSLAAVTTVYVDDLRSGSCTETDCWQVQHQTGSRLSYLGIQVAARKTRPPSRQPGAWAGSVAVVDEQGVAISTTQEKWEKGKRILAALVQEAQVGPLLNFKSLEEGRGFFVHLQRTYPAMTPYLKGMHLTIDAWRPNRDHDGWKIGSPGKGLGHWDKDTDMWVPWVEQDSKRRPAQVRQVPRLKDDLACLQTMLAADEPPKRYVRSKLVCVAVYGFGDASGVGFGSTIQTSDSVLFRYGTWGRDADSESSNFRELCNLVDTLEEGVEDRSLYNAEVWVFTDNSTAEGVFYKGNTPSRKLFGLVLRLRRLEMNGELRIQFVHVAGTRMIRQGADALSRGDLTEGVMNGKDMLSFIPLHLSAVERRPEIVDWIRSWAPEKGLRPLNPEDWFERGHGVYGGCRDANGLWMPHESGEQWLLWTPAPGAADFAVDELGISRHKRTNINHIFVVPRLMTHTWRKKLFKIADVVFEVPAGARPFWPLEEHEPLVIGLTLRFVSCPPWQLKTHERMVAVGGELRGMWPDKDGDEGAVLRKLCLLPGVLESL